MLTDLTCPAEIFRTVLPTDEVPAATLTLFNLSDRVIASAEVQLCLLDGNGTETEKLSYRGRALNGRPHSTFLMTVPCAAAGVHAAEATIEKVWFQDNDVWRRKPENAVEYTPNALPVSRALTSLQYVAGETAVGWPSRQEGLWVCVCGRPNPEQMPVCARCGRQRDAIFANYSPEAVEAQISLRERQLDLNSRSMREDTIRLQRIREEEYMARKARKKQRIRTAIAMALAPALCAGILFFVAPGLRLLAGRRALSEGDPEGAKAIFEALGTFGGADGMIAECDWQTALKKADESRTTDELAEASAMLRALGDRPEAIARADETDMIRARLLLNTGKWREAADALADVPEGLGDRDKMILDCRMAEAKELLDSGEYESARALFLEIRDNQEAADLAAECIYLPATQLMAEEDWDGAVAMLSKIPDYRDSRNLTKQCHYRKAAALENEGDPAAAAAEYLMAGDWGDAQDRYAALTRAQADELMAEGDLKGAHALYASLPDDPEAAEKDRACRYEMAKAAADSLEFSMVLELLEDVPDEYRDTAALRTEAAYRKAKVAVKQQDWETAVTLLQPLDRKALKKKYKDIETLYVNACEGAGIEPYPVTPEPEEEPEPTEPAPAAAETPAPTAAPAETEAPAATATPANSEPTTPPPFLVTEDDDLP